MKVSLQGVSKSFGNQKAVDNLSFEVTKGEVLGFLGPNGAGKSTTMKMITGFLKPDAGIISINDYTIEENENQYKNNIGYLSEANPLYKDLYVKEYLSFVADVHKIHNSKSRIDECIQMTGLEKEHKKKIGSLSKGYKQRVGLAQALLHDPGVLILDEPTSGLDMNQIVEIRSLIQSIKSEKTIIFSTHIMQEVEALCSRVIIIESGKLIADDPIEKLSNRVAGELVLQLEYSGNLQNMMKLKNIDGVIKVNTNGTNSLSVSYSAKKDIREAVFDFFVNEKCKLLGMHVIKPDVESVFQTITKKQ